MGGPVVEGHTGGSKGGGTMLTPLGRAVVRTYRAIEKQAARSVSKELRALSELSRRKAGVNSNARGGGS